MAARMAGVGRVTVSLRKSMMVSGMMGLKVRRTAGVSRLVKVRRTAGVSRLVRNR